MIQVTFTFDSIEKAVATLGSLMQKGAPVPTLANPAVAPETKSTRKPRADAGKARGSYKNAGAPENAVPGAGKAAEQAVNPMPTPEGNLSNPPVASAPEPQPPTAELSTAPSQEGVGQGGVATPTVTPAQAQAALEVLFAAKGLPAAQEVMSRFGVSRLRDMKPEHYSEFAAAATEAAK